MPPDSATLHPGYVAPGSGPAITAAARPEPVEGVKSHLHIAARHAGFRRCGRAWPASGVTVPASDFSAAEIACLHAEPELVVVAVPA
jgi:hypothetical protein